MPARSLDTASISFGLVSIPVRVYATTEPSHEVHFHQIHAGCGQRVHQQLVCPKHGVVTRDQLAKGYEVTKGHTIALDPKELRALDAVSNDEIAIREFVPDSAIDPIFVDRSYYLGPGKGGNRAYRLLRDALESSELVAVASYAARGKSYIVSIRPYETGLIMHQLRYADEVKEWSQVEIGELPKPAAGELELAKSLIAHLEHEAFDPTHYKDDVKGRVRALLAEKAKSGEMIEAPEAAGEPAAPIDLMAALRASLDAPHAGRAATAHAKGKRTAKSGAAHDGHARAHRTTRTRPQARAHARRGASSARTKRS